MITVSNLSKEYRTRRRRVMALQDVSFECVPGEIFALLGRNGAGKTTALRILATILSPTAGSVTVDGYDVTRDGEAVRRRIGFVTGDTRLYDRLTGREALMYFGQLHAMQERTIRERIEELRGRFELSATLDRRIGELSTGHRQRLSLARALMHDPKVLILDEPTVGLDILAARETLRHLRTLREEGRVILFSTHVLIEVERICDRVAILDNGRMLACDPVSALRARFDGDLEEAFVALVTENGAPPGGDAASGTAGPVSTTGRVES